jgi:hypothetical protein
MSYYGSWKIDDLLTFSANTHRFDTGAATDADSAASYRVYEDETSTPLLTGSMALLDSANTAGFYTEQITLSAANGFEKGKSYTIYVSATVNSVTGTMSHNFQMEAEVDANIVSDKTGYGLANGAITAAVIATDAIDADAIADNAIDAGAIAADAITAAKIADGAIDAATFAAGAITATVIATGAIDADAIATDAVTEIQSGLATAANLATVAGYLDTEIAAILADTNELQTDWVDGGRLDLILDSIDSDAAAILADTGTDGVVVAAGSKTGYSLSSAGIQAIWDALTSALTTVGSIGKLLVDNVNATISSRSSHSAADVWSVATRILTAGTNIVLAKGVGVTGFNDLSAAQVNTEADTALSDYDPPTYAELVSEINSVQTDIAALNNLSAAQVNAEVVDVMRTDTLPDSYAADGAQPTIAQALLAIHQFLTEKEVSGTTVTVNKPDGTTSVMTFTLDDATTPTSITRSA